MKKYIFLVLFVFGSMASQSQILITLLLGDKLNSESLEFGLDGGVNWTHISGLETKSFARKWNLGFYFNIQMKNQWFLHTGVLVKSNFGVDHLTDNDMNTLGEQIYETLDGDRWEGDYSHRMNTFQVPAMIKYKFKNHMYVALGPQFNLSYKSWNQFDSDVEGSDATLKSYNREKINRFDVGIAAGLGYTLFKGTGWTFGAKYYYGFLDVFKDVSGTKNSSIYAVINIPVGAGKAKKKREESKLEEQN